MRIRKSQVLFPSSSLSDPHLINRSPVVVQLGDAAPPTAPKSSLLHHAAAQHHRAWIVISRLINHSHRSGNEATALMIPPAKDEDVRKQDIEDSGEKVNHTRKGSNFGLEMHAEVFPLSSPSSAQDERWCEGEKAIPLKKRRGSFDNGKGRLRSMTSVRSRSIATSIAPKKQNNKSVIVTDPAENDEKKPVIITKKRMKLGMVKARSISSLLGQPTHRCCCTLYSTT
ncbi:hypothetical protein SESBI_32875 [Sesbania bispinosa]|nr:hypothetical protein SESBI_32875 [Sesbania bispinosa]